MLGAIIWPDLKNMKTQQRAGHLHYLNDLCDRKVLDSPGQGLVFLTYVCWNTARDVKKWLQEHCKGKIRRCAIWKYLYLYIYIYIHIYLILICT